MAKPIVVKYNGAVSSFAHEKLDRTKLYGRRQRQILDPSGQRCERAELTRDGALLIRAGMTKQGYFDGAGAWIPGRALVGLSPAGEPVPQVPATLGVEQELTGPVPPEQLLDLAVRSIYCLTPETVDPALLARLHAGEVFRCPFNYRADYQAETAFLVANKAGLFALVGDPTESPWSELALVAQETFDDAADDDELDFEMF
jgi:hypothetical protein